MHSKILYSTVKKELSDTTTYLKNYQTRKLLMTRLLNCWHKSLCHYRNKTDCLIMIPNTHANSVERNIKISEKILILYIQICPSKSFSILGYSLRNFLSSNKNDILFADHADKVSHPLRI